MPSLSNFPRIGLLNVGIKYAMNRLFHARLLARVLNVYFVHAFTSFTGEGDIPLNTLKKLCKNHCENQRARNHFYRRVTALLKVPSGILHE